MNTHSRSELAPSLRLDTAAVRAAAAVAAVVAVAAPQIGCMGSSQPAQAGPPPVAAAREKARTAPAEGAPARGNPFAGGRFFVDPAYVAKVESTAIAMPDSAASLRRVEAYPTGLWIDAIARVAEVPRWLDAAKQQQASGGTPVVPVLVLYDLPNRDCAAKSSNGELAAAEGGEARYRNEVVDPLAALFAARPDQRVVLILEPDSLANLATNLNVPRCAESADVYRRSVAYAISKLSLPHVAIYLDAAHAGWLGWAGNRTSIARIFRRVLDEAGGVEKIRGFATNVANYNVLRGDDGRKLDPSNPCADELTYVAKLADSLGAAGITDKGFIVDTSRNGRGGIRRRWGSWCNVSGAGLGERPRIAPAPLVDAYFWVKPPGDSDGVSDAAAPRYDPSCRSPDSAADAPQAGAWYPAYFLQLVANANPPI